MLSTSHHAGVTLLPSLRMRGAARLVRAAGMAPTAAPTRRSAEFMVHMSYTQRFLTGRRVLATVLGVRPHAAEGTARTGTAHVGGILGGTGSLSSTPW